MSRIFISYRRDDAAGHARGLYDRLVRHFGRDQVFMDLGIKPSQDFTRQINAALARCDVLLAVIGREWSRARDEHGRRRLDDPEDWLRLEIATALRREDVAIFPVLVQDAPMPRADELPDDLKGLTRLQAHELADGHGWDGDVDFLADAMRRRIGAATAVPALVHALGAAALLLVPAFAAAEAVKVWDRPDPASVEALVRLGAVHAAAWALLAGGAAAGAALAIRGAGATGRAAVAGALAGALGGLLGGAIDQALRADGSQQLGYLLGFAITGAIAAAGRLAGRSGPPEIAGGLLGGALGGLLAFEATSELLALAWPALLAIAGAGLAGIAARVLAEHEHVPVRLGHLQLRSRSRETT